MWKTATSHFQFTKYLPLHKNELDPWAVHVLQKEHPDSPWNWKKIARSNRFALLSRLAEKSGIRINANIIEVRFLHNSFPFLFLFFLKTSEFIYREQFKALIT